MPNDESTARLEKANAVRLQVFAERAAQDPAKLARAARIVRAALDLDLLSVDELVDGDRDKVSA